MNYSPPGSSVHGISQARILEWVAIYFSRGYSRPRIKPESLHCQAGSLALSHQRSLSSPSEVLTSFTCLSWCVCSVAKLCPTLCNPMDSSLPDSSVHGTFQARTLEWVVISFSRRSSQPRDWNRVSWVFWIGKWILYQCANWEAIIIVVSAKFLHCKVTLFYLFKGYVFYKEVFWKL